MNETEILTPRTDAHILESLSEKEMGDYLARLNRIIPFCRQLERENAAMRAEIAETKQVLQQVDLPDEPLVVQAKRYVDQHDWHVGINRGQAKQIDDANRVNAAMREVMKEALESLDCLSLVVGLTPILGNKGAIQEANDQARATLSKFKASYLP